MSLVLAIEPDSAQAEPLTAVVRARLGAQLQMVASSHAAVVAINQRVPDVLLIGRDVQQDQRTRIVTHLRSVSASSQVRILDIPQLNEASGLDALAKKIGACLAAAEDARVRAMASMMAPPADSDWGEVALDEAAPAVEPTADPEPADDDMDLRAAEVSLIEAEVEFRLQTELERLHAEAARQQAAELARVEAEAAERRAAEVARLEAEAAAHRARELARIEQEAAAQRELAVAEARAAAETAAREALAAELDRVRHEAEQRLAEEVRRVREEAQHMVATKLDAAQVEAERDREIARIEAEAAQRRAIEVERIEREAAAQREAAAVEARATAEAAAREALAAEVERVRLETEQQLADEISRVRREAEQMLASQRDAAQADADRDREERIARAREEAEAARAAAEEERAAAEADRAAAEADRAAAIEEARRIVELAAARAREAEDEVERVRLEADAQLKEAVARARAENDARLQEQVARAQAETEARLEAQLASVMGENEQVRHAHRQATVDADKIRMEAAYAARAAAEEALAAETARIRAEADERLDAEITRLRAEAAVVAERAVAEMPAYQSNAESDDASMLARVSQFSLHAIRWDLVATAALILLVVIAGVLYLPRAVTTAARTSSALVGTAGKAAQAAAREAAAVAPVVTRRALTAAEHALPRPAVVNAKNRSKETVSADVEAAAAAVDSGPGFLTAFSRIPMDVYADGARIGTTEDGQLLLNSGRHNLEFVSDRFHYRAATRVTIRPGHVLPYTVPLPSGQVHVTTTPGTQVLVDGEPVGVAPLGAIQVPIGTREIRVKSATAEKRQAIEVKFGETIDVSLVPEAVTEAGPSTPHLAPLQRRY